MNNIELCQKIWNKINFPHSTCPDVEIGYVEQVMAELLAECLPVEGQLDRLLLAKILIKPTDHNSLDYLWQDIIQRQIPRPAGDNPNDLDKYYKAIDASGESAHIEVAESIKRLVEKNLIELRENVYWPLGPAHKVIE
jgi:hypothetical protein